MKRTVLTSIILAFCALSSAAQSLPDMVIPADPQDIAMGGMLSEGSAFAADCNVSASVFSDGNVCAGASVVRWSPLFSNLSSMNAGAVLRFGRVGVAFAAKRNAGKSYTAYNEQWQPVGEFRPFNDYGAAGVAVRVTECLSAGVTGRYCRSSIAADAVANAFAGDVSLTWQGRIVRASAAICNLGTPVRYAEGGSEGTLPRLARAGVAAEFLDCLRIGCEADFLMNDSSLMFTAGAEYSFRDLVSVRAGYHYGGSRAVIPSYASVGATIRLWCFELGAAYLTASEVLGNSLMFSLAFSL